MEFTKTVAENKITLSVTVKSELLTEDEKREIINSLAALSHRLYLDVAQELNDKKR